MQPNISIVIAAWNASQTIDRCIESARTQVGVEVEVIVVDDCSTDQTREIISRVSSEDPRVRLLRAESNGGPAAARNLALTTARAPWVAVLDSDDSMEPNRCSTLICLAERTQADIVLDNLKLVADDSELQFEQFLTDVRFASPQSWTLLDFISGNVGGSSSKNLGYLKPILRRRFLEDHGITYDPSLRNSEDYHLIAECLAQGANLWFHPEPLYRYTIRLSSISHRVRPEYLEALLDAEDRFRVRHEHRLDDELLAIMTRRKAEISKLRTTEFVLGAIKRFDIVAAASALLLNPCSIPKILEHLRQTTIKRLGRAVAERFI